MKFPVLSAALTWVLLAQPLSAEQAPSLQYFVGEYLAIGRAAGSLIEGTALVTESNGHLQLHTDFLGKGWLSLNDSPNEFFAPLAGEIGDKGIFCLYKNDSDNYPIINCRLDISVERGLDGYLTLWPND